MRTHVLEVCLHFYSSIVFRGDVGSDVSSYREIKGEERGKDFRL